MTSANKVTYHYDSFARLSDTTFSTGIHTAYQYDSYNHLQTLDHYSDTTRQHAIIQFIFVYGKDDNLRERIRTNNKGQRAIERYGYDHNNDLQNYTCLGALCPQDSHGQTINYQHYIFDHLNNIQSVSSNHTTTTYFYDKTLPTRLVAYQNNNPSYGNSNTLIYDPNGNIIQDDQHQLITYDPLNETLSVTNQQGTTFYFYNGEGTQISEHSPAKINTYFLYGKTHLLTIKKAQNTVSFIYGLTQLGRQDQNGENDELTDQNQSIVASINRHSPHSALNIKRYIYSPYGVEHKLDQPKQETKSESHFGFDGQLTDPQTHWQFLGHGYRAYNPILHRFMQQDASSPFEQGGLNGYIFGNNNPISMYDPSGHNAILANLGWSLAMGLLIGVLTAEMGGEAAFAFNMLANTASSNINTIMSAIHGHNIIWKHVGIQTGINTIANVMAWGLGQATALSEIETTREFTESPLSSIAPVQAESISKQNAYQLYMRYINNNQPEDCTTLSTYEELVNRIRLKNYMTDIRGGSFDMQIMKAYLLTYANGMTEEEREQIPIQLMFKVAKNGESNSIRGTVDKKFKEEALAVLHSADSFESFADLWEEKIKSLGLTTQNPLPPRSSEPWRGRYVSGILGRTPV